MIYKQKTGLLPNFSIWNKGKQMYRTLIIYLITLFSLFHTNQNSFAFYESNEEEETKEISVFKNIEFELTYTYVGVSSDDEFKAVGDWNKTGTSFSVATKASGSPLGLAVGLRWFVMTDDNTGLLLGLRVGLSAAKLSINWVSSSGEPLESSGFLIDPELFAGYKLSFGDHLLARNQSIYVIPEVGVGWEFFSSQPTDSDESESEASFSFNAPSVIFRLAFEVDVTPKIGILLGFEYHLAFSWSAKRTFFDGTYMDGEAEGSANIWKIVAGISF